MEMNNVYKMLVMKPERKRGRLRDEDLGKIRCEYVEWIEMA
jgi:hypothetical protein